MAADGLLKDVGLGILFAQGFGWAMPRVQFKGLAEGARAAVELVVDRPHQTRPGYTPVMWLTEWLTLNCREDWAMRVDSKAVVLRFSSVSDRDRVAQEMLVWNRKDPE